MNIPARRTSAFFAAITSSCAFVVLGVFACSTSSEPVRETDGGPLEDASSALDGSTSLDSSGDASSTSLFGQPCTVGADAACGEGLFCLQGPSGGKVGFCTRKCPKTSSQECSDAPAGTAAYCVVTDVDKDGNKGCAFVCAQGASAFACPGKLRCQTTEEPPGSGQRLCLP